MLPFAYQRAPAIPDALRATAGQSTPPTASAPSTRR